MITMPVPANLAEDRRLLARDDAICDALRTVVRDRGLSPDAESDIWVAARKQIEPILHLADDVTVARVELEALDRRLGMHAEGCAGCYVGQPCQRYRVLQIRRKRLQDKADRAFRALLDGKRR